MQNQLQREMFATNFNTRASNCRCESFVHEDELAELRKENADLRNQMEVLALKKYTSDRKCKDALRIVRELKYELELADSCEAEIRQKLYRAHQELKKQRACANGMTWSNPEEQSVATQTDDTEISELVEKQLQSHRTQWKGERTNLQNTIEILQQTQKEKQEEWSNTVQKAVKQQLQSHMAQWQDERTTLQNTIKNLLKTQKQEEGWSNTVQKTTTEQLQSHMTQWQDERTALQNTIENLQQTQKEKQEEWSNTVTAVEKTAKEQLQSHMAQWQDERTALKNSCDKLQKTLMEKVQEWSEKKRKMETRIDEFEQKMIEAPKKESKKNSRGFFGKLLKTT